MILRPDGAEAPICDITAPRHSSMNDELDADQLTVDLLLVLHGSDACTEYKVSALRSAVETLLAMDELERKLETRGQYELTDNAVFRVAE